MSELTIERIRELRAGLKAPWRIIGYSGEHDEMGASIDDDDGLPVCRTAYERGRLDTYTQRAQFIAAAPEAIDFLLAKLDEMRDALSNIFCVGCETLIGGPGKKYSCGQCKAARAALAQHHGTEGKK